MSRRLSILLAVAALSATSLMAERYTPVGVITNSGRGLEVVVAPSATLIVVVEAEREVIEVGEYARYAQKYLGVRAPMVAKQSARILSASVRMADKNYFVMSEIPAPQGFAVVSTSSTPLQIDITTPDPLSLEESAEEAASQIFTIREMRRDILSGELGEGFYSAGLAASLERLAEEERQLVELFMGRTTTSHQSETYMVALDGATERYIVGRFSATEGLVPATELASEPILLQLTPMKSERMASRTVDEKSQPVKFRIAERVKCELFCSNRLLGLNVMPLYEFGYDYIHAVPLK